jgi:hypothetical protein
MRRTTLYTLEVTITGGPMADDFVARNPVISRTIEIRADQTLNQLHRAIFQALDRWDDCHLSQFNLGAGIMDGSGDRYVLPFIFAEPERYEETSAAGSMTETRIGGLGLQVGRVFWYEYDYGDDWQHSIEVIAIGEAEPKVKYPRVAARIGESPPQYREWDEDGEDETSEDWLDEVLEHGAAVLAMESGIIPIDADRFVAWIRRRISERTASLAGDRAAVRHYHVTTLRRLPDGTGELTIYIVPGAYLDPWLNAVVGDDGETVLSVEMA